MVRTKGKRRGCLRLVLRLAGVSLLLLAIVVAFKAVTWPDVAALADENPETTAFIERGKRRAPDHRVSWSWVPYSRISPNLKRAVVVSEDINFFSHDGFDRDQISDAISDAIEEKHFPRGASTISQQTAKNLWLSPSKLPTRKLEEAILTRQLEDDLSKRRILEIYLNVVELGPGIYGAEAASRHYFGVSAADLSERQAAMLAASLPRPKRWNPSTSSRGYRRAVDRVLRRMQKAQWLWKVI